MITLLISVYNTKTDYKHFQYRGFTFIYSLTLFLFLPEGALFTCLATSILFLLEDPSSRSGRLSHVAEVVGMTEG